MAAIRCLHDVTGSRLQTIADCISVRTHNPMPHLQSSNPEPVARHAVLACSAVYLLYTARVPHATCPPSTGGRYMSRCLHLLTGSPVDAQDSQLQSLLRHSPRCRRSAATSLSLGRDSSRSSSAWWRLACSRETPVSRRGIAFVGGEGLTPMPRRRQSGTQWAEAPLHRAQPDARCAASHVCRIRCCAVESLRSSIGQAEVL